jgi:hypothetical protein
MKPAAPKPRLWPRWAIGPLGNRAIFHCAGDIPPKWKLEIPLPVDVYTIDDVYAIGPTPQAVEPFVPPPPVDDLAAARAEYLAVFGKRPGPQWSADTIRTKIMERPVV